MSNLSDARGSWAASASLGEGIRSSTVINPPRRKTAHPTTHPTKGAPDPYISHPSADVKNEGDETDHAQVNGQPTKEAIANLVEQAKRGGSEAFGEIYRLHHQALFRYARYRLGQQAAEDAVSETFVRAWQGLPRYRETGAPFVSWLYGIARHVVVDAGNAERRVEPRGEFPDHAIELALGTVDHIELADAISALPQKQRQVIELKFLIGLNNEEVGKALGKSPGAVNAQQWRALEGLKRIMGTR
ncbi:MAG: RNA polymerase sigma factor [Actinomycetota bacterium]